MALPRPKIVLAIFLVIFLLNIFTARAWWDSNWLYSYPINITHNNGTHTNEPIFLNVSNATCAYTNKSDLRVVYQNATVLDYQWWWPTGQTTNDTVTFLANSTNADSTNYFAYCNNTAANTDASKILFNAIDRFQRPNSDNIGNLEWPQNESWTESNENSRIIDNQISLTKIVSNPGGWAKLTWLNMTQNWTWGFTVRSTKDSTDNMLKMQTGTTALPNTLRFRMHGDTPCNTGKFNYFNNTECTPTAQVIQAQTTYGITLNISIYEATSDYWDASIDGILFVNNSSVDANVSEYTNWLYETTLDLPEGYAIDDVLISNTTVFTVYGTSASANLGQLQLNVDTTPPSNITNLNETSTTSSSITWAWTNPSDSDFNHTEVWLDGTFKENVSAPTNGTTISGLSPSTIYEIQVRPVDNVTNIGSWTNDTAQTNDAPPPPPPTTTGGGGGGGGSGLSLPQETVVIGHVGRGESKKAVFQLWDKHYIQTVNVAAKENISNGAIRVTRYYTKPGAVSDAGAVFTYISVDSINFKSDSIQNAEIEFLANSSWIEKNAAGMDVVLLHYESGEWKTINTRRVGAIEDKHHFAAPTESFSFFAIGAKEKVQAAELPAPAELIPAESEAVSVATVEESELSGPSGFAILNQAKNPYVIAVIGAILFAGLVGYTLYTGKVKLPKLSVPKIEKPKFEFLQRLKEIRMPKISMPKLPELKFERKTQRQILSPSEQKPLVIHPRIIVRPKIVYEKIKHDEPKTKIVRAEEAEKIASEAKLPRTQRNEVPLHTRSQGLRVVSHSVRDEIKVPVHQPAFPTLAKPYAAQPLRVNAHMKSILSALHYREREVLETLILHGGKSTMARIFHYTGMPPTTLFRWIVSLENRGLVRTTKIGKLRRIELTEKFFGETQIARPK